MIDNRQARDWLLTRLNSPPIMARLERFEDVGEEFADKPLARLSETDLHRIWIDLSNGVSDLPSTSSNLDSANHPAILRAATQIAQTLADPVGTRWVNLCAFFKHNGEPVNQLAHYVRAAALFDPGHAPTVTAYRGLTPRILEALGYRGTLTPWETLIQTKNADALNPAIEFVFETIAQILPGADDYALAVGLELLPGYVKEVLNRTDKPAP